jgi:trk/ktr system potassium uptake protein
LTGIFYLTGLMLNVIAGAMAFTTLLALSVNEPGMAMTFLVSTAMLVFVGGSLTIALRGRNREMRRIEVMGLAAVIWTIVPIFCALPFWLSGASQTLVGALFESVSGFTTTGSTLFESLDQVPRAIILWRAILQWIGGLTTVLVVLLVFAPAQLGGIPERPLALIESGARSVKKRILSTTGRIAPLYALITLVCFIGLTASGLPLLDSFSIALSAVSTGGFMPRDGGMGAYGSHVAEAIAGLAMLIGGTNFIWHRMLAQGRWPLAKQHREAFWFIGLAVIVGVYFTWSFYYGLDGPAGLSFLTALQTGFFTAVSLISTTGIEFREGGFAILSLPLLLGICLIGGAGFSTAGGVKLYRAGAMLAQGNREIRRLIYPHGVRPAHFGGQVYDIQMMKSVWSIFILYLGISVALAALLGLFGFNFESAVTVAIANLANAGPVYEALANQNPDWPAYNEASIGGQVTLIFAMILGRLEIIGLIVVFNRTFWRS